MSMDCAWDTSLISFPHDAGVSLPGPVVPHLDSREISHLDVGSLSLASRKRGPGKDQSFSQRCGEGEVRRFSTCHPVTSCDFCNCIFAAASRIW